MVQFRVFEEQQEQGRDALYNDLLVPVPASAQLHALENSDATTGKGRESVREGGLREGLRGHIQYTSKPEPETPELCRKPPEFPLVSVWRKSSSDTFVSLSPLASLSLSNVHPHTHAASDVALQTLSSGLKEHRESTAVERGYWWQRSPWRQSL